MDYDEFYCILSSLQNLKLLKLAYDYGLDVSTYKDFHATSHEGNWGNYNTFLSIVYDMFEIVDQWAPYTDENENMEKRYWIQQAWKDVSLESIDSDGIIVIFDDRIKEECVQEGEIFGGYPNDFNYGYAEIYPLEHGVVIQYNEDEGEVDWVEVFYALILTLIRSEKQNEMAIGDIRYTG